MATLKIVVPAIITLTNTSSKSISFVPYRENFTSELTAGNAIELEASTAGQVLYYLGQATTGLTVTQAAKADEVTE